MERLNKVKEALEVLANIDVNIKSNFAEHTILYSYRDSKIMLSDVKKAQEALKELDSFMERLDSEELAQVLNNKFDYIKRRKALSEISGVPMMAIVTDDHIKKIAWKVESQEKEIERLNGVISKTQAAINTIKGNNND